MTLDEKRRAYQAFFLKNEAGKNFMSHLELLIKQDHEAAETSPENARDFVQRAKGVREVIAHIQSLTAERNRRTT